MKVKQKTKKDEEQLKKLATLFLLITCLDESVLTADELFKQCCQLISEKWISPKKLSVLIDCNGEIYKSDNFKESGSKLSSSASVKDYFITLTVYSSDGDFSESEEILVNVLANKLSVKYKRIQDHQELKESQELLEKAYKLARIGTWEYDMINDKLHWSDDTKEVHGFGPDYEPDVESTIMLFKEGYNRDTFAKAVENAIQNYQPFDVELKIISGEGDERWIRATGHPEFRDGVCTRFYGISQNVTDRRKAEEEVALNDRRFRALVQHGMDLIAILDEEANYKFVSPTSKNVLGYPPEFYIGKNALDFIHPDDKERLLRQFNSLKPQETTQLRPFRFQNEKGDWLWIESAVTNLSEDPAVKGFVVNSRDVTERQIKKEQVLDSLKEKETLLSEIHHRIKNNLSVLTGLLQLQATTENNEEVIERLFDSVARINTMASIHEQLYQTSNFSSIEFADRLQMLIMNIKKSFQTQTDVELNFQCEPVEVPLEKALPVSLIANEVVTNIFKHAFKDVEKGKITIELEHIDVQDYVRLTIRDDGGGLPNDFDPEKSKSLGLSLINMLSEQLPGEYNFNSTKKGVEFNLQFKVK